MKKGIIVFTLALLIAVGLSVPQGKAEARAVYVANTTSYQFGMWQIKSNALAPSGFSWLDNGIPLNAVNKVGSYGASSFTFSFKPSAVWQTNNVVVDYGRTWRQFTTPWGSFWSVARDWNDLVY